MILPLMAVLSWLTTFTVAFLPCGYWLPSLLISLALTVCVRGSKRKMNAHE